MVASGWNSTVHITQAKVVRLSFGWRTDPYAFNRSGSLGPLPLISHLESRSTEEEEGGGAVGFLEEGPAITERYGAVRLFCGGEFGSSLESPMGAEDTEVDCSRGRVGDFSRETYV